MILHFNDVNIFLTKVNISILFWTKWLSILKDLEVNDEKKGGSEHNI